MCKPQRIETPQTKAPSGRLPSRMSRAASAALVCNCSTARTETEAAWLVSTNVGKRAKWAVGGERLFFEYIKPRSLNFS